MLEKTISDYNIVFQYDDNKEMQIGLMVEDVGDEFSDGRWQCDGLDIRVWGRSKIHLYKNVDQFVLDAIARTGTLHILDVNNDVISFCSAKL